MALSIGTRIGPYEITAAIGRGGMGEVWRATDTALGRHVAVKVLPDAFLADPDRLARFEREARTLAALNHSNIAAIYGVQRGEGVHALIMECVDGPTLADLIAAAPQGLPLGDALPIAIQMVEALDAAHAQGIIHRDLKPANVKVRGDGLVKVLDFGLAKTMEPATSDLLNSPTMTSPMTGLGVILGTAAYMSPEQARGRAVDRRTDIWAFGCVLYEMLTGERPFAGEDLAETTASILKAEPDWARLPEGTPPAIRRVLRRTLVKDRRRRLADIADVRLELEEAAAPDAGSVARADVPRGRVWPWIAAGTTGLLAGAALMLGLVGLRGSADDRRIVRLDVTAADEITEFAAPLSPDGRLVAFVMGSARSAGIWVHSLDTGTARPLPGTEGASRVFWSPDSRSVAYFVDGNLRRVAIDGGAPQQLAVGPFRDGAWSRDGTILLGGQRGRPLMRVSELGGTPTPETALDEETDVSHDYPEFLPGGRHYVYLVRGRRAEDWVTFIGTLGSKDRRPLPDIRVGVRYSPTGHLLFLRGLTLMAQPFDAGRLELTGEPFPLAEQVLGGRIAPFSISDNGSLAYLVAPSLDSELAWFDRSGRRLGTVAGTGEYRGATVSTDGRFVAFYRGVPFDVWIQDIERGRSSPFASDATASTMPVWKPGDRTVVFGSLRSGRYGLYRRSVGSDSEDRLLEGTSVELFPTDWSRDGQHVAYEAGGDVWALPLSGGAPLQVTMTPVMVEGRARFAPNGRWIAYQSDEAAGLSRSGEADIYIQSFPARGIKERVSASGGTLPRWSRDGSELFFVAPDGTLMVVPVAELEGTLEVGVPTPLFKPGFGRVESATYDVADDGRFLISLREPPRRVRVILNGVELLRQ